MHQRPCPTLSPQLYINRELSWLEFNARVLHEAFDARNAAARAAQVPRDLQHAISTSSTWCASRGCAGRSPRASRVAAPDGLTPQEQLDAIARRVRELLAQQQQLPARAAASRAGASVACGSCSMNELTPARVARRSTCSSSRRSSRCSRRSRSIPGIRSRTSPTSRCRSRSRSAIRSRRSSHFARVKVPKSLPRWVPFGRANQFVPLEQRHRREPRRALSRDGGPRLVRVPGHALFGSRARRNRRAGRPARDDRGAGVPAPLRRGGAARGAGRACRRTCATLLLEELRDDRPAAATRRSRERDVHEMRAAARARRPDASSRTLDIPELRDPPFVPVDAARSCATRTARSSTSSASATCSCIIRSIRSRPRSSSSSSGGARRARARDQAHAVPHLGRHADRARAHRGGGARQAGRGAGRAQGALRRGEQHHVGAHARELRRARRVRAAGLKTHTKTCLVVRREADGIRRYVHIGTGQLQLEDGAQYTDLGLFTCSPSIGADLSDLFNSLTGFSRQRLYRKLLVAPGEHARAVPRADRARERARARTAGRRAHHREDERAGRSGDDRRAVSTHRRRAWRSI